MAAAAVSASLTASSAGARLCEFEGLKASAKPAQVQRLAMVPKSVNSKGALGTRSYLGSPTNLIIVGSTTLLLIAGRFGLAPSANRKSTAGLKLVDRNSGLQTGDPAGFTIADTLAFGSMGHLIGVGVVLGLKATGGL